MRGAAPAQRAEGAEARPAAARSPRRLATSSRGPHGIRKFPDISGHVRSYQEGRPRGRRGCFPRLRHTPHWRFLGAGSSAQVAAHQAQCGSGTRRAGSGREPRRGLLPGTRVHPAGLHACPAGPSRVTAQDTP